MVGARDHLHSLRELDWRHMTHDLPDLDAQYVHSKSIVPVVKGRTAIAAVHTRPAISGAFVSQPANKGR